MERKNHTSTISATVAFIVTALISSILIVSALVFFIGELIGSHLLAMVIVAGVCGIISWIIYRSSLKPVIKEIEDQLTTIYEVANAAHRAYTWAVEYLISRIFKE